MFNPTQIVDNIKSIRSRLNEAALRRGTNPNDVLLLAASKSMPPVAIAAAISAGVDAIGENKVQELLAKFDQNAYNNSPLHFIGHLQKNKVKFVVGICDLIHSVDSPDLAALINKYAAFRNIIQDVLIQVNIADESSKGGVHPSKLQDLLDFIRPLNNIRVSGLMAIPPRSADSSYFHEMFKLYVDIKTKSYDNSNIRFLSMGMSDDFERAVLAGANLVRLGSAIFGHRY